MNNWKFWLLIAITIGSTFGAIALSQVANEAQPERFDVPSETSASAEPTTEPTSSASPSATAKPLIIKASDILNVKIPALHIDADASGATMPRQSDRCHASTVCIDPPSLSQVAWYGAYARPSVPSTDSVIIFGHSNWINRQLQAFNNLPKAEKGDKIVVTTKTGVFTYQVTKRTLVDYDKIANSQLVYGHVPNRLVLVTCNAHEQAGTVVVADLVSAKKR